MVRTNTQKVTSQRKELQPFLFPVWLDPNQAQKPNRRLCSCCLGLMGSVSTPASAWSEAHIPGGHGFLASKPSFHSPGFSHLVDNSLENRQVLACSIPHVLTVAQCLCDHQVKPSLLNLHHRKHRCVLIAAGQGLPRAGLPQAGLGVWILNFV